MELLNKNINWVIRHINNSDKSKSIVFMNPHSYCQYHLNEEFRLSINRNSIILIDGILLKIALKIKKKEKIFKNIGEKTLFSYLRSETKKRKNILIIGPDKKKGNKFINYVAEELNLDFNFEIYELPIFKIKLNNNIFLDLLSLINKNKYDIIINTIGAPKQEILSNRIVNNVKYKTLIFNVGAVIDFTTQKKYFLLKYFRFLNIEWLYRMIISPIKISKRIFISGPYFLYIFFVKK